MTSRRSFGRLVGIATLLVPLVAGAQCTNLSGNPAPQPEPYAANLVKLRYLATGPGSGDDRPELRKSAVTAPSFAFDPLATHTMHVTFSTSPGGLPLWSASIPPSSTLWVQTNLPNGNIRWRYSDPATTFGVRKIQVVWTAFANLYVVTRFQGRNTNITNAPVTAGVDAAHVLVEMESGGVGICYDGVSAPCTGTANTQTCKVL